MLLHKQPQATDWWSVISRHWACEKGEYVWRRYIFSLQTCPAQQSALEHLAQRAVVTFRQLEGAWGAKQTLFVCERAGEKKTGRESSLVKIALAHQSPSIGMRQCFGLWRSEMSECPLALKSTITITKARFSLFDIVFFYTQYYYFMLNTSLKK